MATLTTVVPKQPIAPGQSIAIYSLAFDSGYPTGGESIAVTDFQYVYSVLFGGNDTLADNGYIFRTVVDYAVATATTAPTISVWWNFAPAGSGGADRVDVEFTNGGSLAAVGKCQLVVIGR